MSEVNETQTSEYETDNNTAITEPTDEYPGSFFRILAPPSLNDTWSLN
jgi:hypothetical protein